MLEFKHWLEHTQVPQTWYHGTNSEHLPLIQQHGLKNPYLTSKKEIARDYAEAAPGNGRPIIIVLHVPTPNFSVDHISLKEPLAYGKLTGQQMDQRVQDLYAKTGREISDHDWALTYPITKTVRYNGIIPSQYIIKIIE